MRISSSGRLHFNSILKKSFSTMSSSKPKHAPAPARSAACVILVRPTLSNSYKVLMVERMARDGSQFLNAHVFPGGQVDPSDNSNVGKAALRELYEEVSINLLPSESAHRVTSQLVDSSTPFSEYLAKSKVRTCENRLIPYSRWITPKFMKKRFDTTFFLALEDSTNSSVQGKVDGIEIKSLSWLTPAEALSQFSDRKITLFPPQWYILSDLNDSASTFSDLCALIDKLPKMLRPMAPQAQSTSKTGFTMVLPGDEEYIPEDESVKVKPGARYRVIIVSEGGRPRNMRIEKTVDITSKL